MGLKSATWVKNKHSVLVIMQPAFLQSSFPIPLALYMPVCSKCRIVVEHSYWAIYMVAMKVDVC